MSSFLFLHFCDDALWLLGLYFFEFILSELSSGGFLLLLHKPPQGPHSGPTGRVRSFPGVVPYPALKTAHGRPQGRVCFSLQNEFTPPPKGGGAGYRLSWIRRVCPARSKLGHVGPTGPVRGFAGVVPHPALKTAHRATQGRVWFHRRFLVRFFCGIPASWRSRWQSTAS